jgi:hypothetical protein
VLALVLLAGCAAGPAHPGQQATPRAAHPAASATSQAATRRSRIVALLVARASPTVAYVLASAHAGPAGPSLELFRTGNAGQRFRRVSAPVVRSRGTGRPMAVRSMTFLNPDDGIAIIGTPDQREPLLMTVDGARSWHRVSLGSAGVVWAVAGRGSSAYALTLRCVRNLPCRDPRLFSVAAGSLAWTRQPATGIAGAVGPGGTGLAAAGSSAWLTAGNGEAPAIGLLGSADSGRTFRRQTAIVAVACSPAASSPRVVWLTCSEGMSDVIERYAVGAARTRLLPVGGAGTGNTFVDPLSDQVVYFGTALGHWAGLYLSRDAGRHFTRTGWLPGPESGLTTTVTFLTVSDALAVSYGQPLLRTADGGMTWTGVRL